MIKGCIFDLDGVIVDSAKYHFISWRKLANELGFDFTEEANEKLKGVSRMESLDLILGWGGVVKTAQEKKELAKMKNEWYLELISDMRPEEVLPGVTTFIDQLRRDGVKTAIGSASKNAVFILKQVGLYQDFDAIIDGTATTKGKPDPQVFLLGADALGLDPSECLVFEDARKGIEAAIRGGFWSVGIGDPEVLDNAHLVVPGLTGLNLKWFTSKLQIS